LHDGLTCACTEPQPRHGARCVVSIRDQLQAVVGKKVDMSILKVGGPFDHEPYLPIP